MKSVEGVAAGVAGVPARPFAARTRAYVRLAKPRIIELLVITTVPAMILAAGGIPDLRLVGATLVGGALAAGSANAANCYLERDIDALMARTSRRPMVRGEIPPVNAVVFALVIGLAGVGLIALSSNLLAAALTAAAALYYIFVYTLVLKRRTSQNIVIGGIAGCMPVLIGWAAVTGELALPAYVMFAIVFVWTPPHFWALAIKHRHDYASARVPMLPSVAGVEETVRRIRRYVIALITLTIVLAPVAGLGWVYAIAVATLGAGLLMRTAELERTHSDRAAMGLFRYSISYLGLVFAAVALDVLVGLW